MIMIGCNIGTVSCPTVNQACVKADTWSCKNTYSKCDIVEYKGWLYGVTEDILEPSPIEPRGDARFTRGLTFKKAVAWIAQCVGCCETVEGTDTFGSVRINADGSLTYINADGTLGPTWVSYNGSEPVESEVVLRPNANFKWVPTLDANKIATLEEPVTNLAIFDGHDGMTDNGNGGIVIPKDGAYIVSVSGGTIWLSGTPRTSAGGAVNADVSGFAIDLDGVGIGGTGTQEWTYAREGSKIHQSVNVGFMATQGQVLTLRTLMGASHEGHVSIGGLKGYVAWQSDA